MCALNLVGLTTRPVYIYTCIQSSDCKINIESRIWVQHVDISILLSWNIYGMNLSKLRTLSTSLLYWLVRHICFIFLFNHLFTFLFSAAAAAAAAAAGLHSPRDSYSPYTLSAMERKPYFSTGPSPGLGPVLNGPLGPPPPPPPQPGAFSGVPSINVPSGFAWGRAGIRAAAHPSAEPSFSARELRRERQRRQNRQGEEREWERASLAPPLHAKWDLRRALYIPDDARSFFSPVTLPSPFSSIQRPIFRTGPLVLLYLPSSSLKLFLSRLVDFQK